ncbi:hypothetical protein D3C71_1393510 [compost metagenome]
MALGNESNPTKVVAPVVVKPENDSKKASVSDRLGRSENKNGNAPTLPSTVQNSTTIKKPSRGFNSCFCLRLGHHSIRPMVTATKKVWLNARPAPSRYINATRPGINIVPENRMTNKPTIRVIARKCISARSLTIQLVGIIAIWGLIANYRD